MDATPLPIGYRARVDLKRQKFPVSTGCKGKPWAVFAHPRTDFRGCEQFALRPGAGTPRVACSSVLEHKKKQVFARARTQKRRAFDSSRTQKEKRVDLRALINQPNSKAAVFGRLRTHDNDDFPQSSPVFRICFGQKFGFIKPSRGSQEAGEKGGLMENSPAFGFDSLISARLLEVAQRVLWRSVRAAFDG